MSKQTAKQFVLSRYPDAKDIERMTPPFYKVMFSNGRSGIGNTRGDAWYDAKQQIEEMEKKNE